MEYNGNITWKWTWRKKFIYMLTLLPIGVQTKQLKIFLLKSFSICHRCHRHRWCTLELWISLWILEKFKRPLWNTQGLRGNWSMKTWSQKYRGTVPLMLLVSESLMFKLYKATLRSLRDSVMLFGWSQKILMHYTIIGWKFRSRIKLILFIFKLIDYSSYIYPTALVS